MRTPTLEPLRVAPSRPSAGMISTVLSLIACGAGVVFAYNAFGTRDPYPWSVLFSLALGSMAIGVGASTLAVLRSTGALRDRTIAVAFVLALVLFVAGSFVASFDAEGDWWLPPLAALLFWPMWPGGWVAIAVVLAGLGLGARTARRAWAAGELGRNAVASLAAAAVNLLVALTAGFLMLARI